MWRNSQHISTSKQEVVGSILASYAMTLSLYRAPRLGSGCRTAVERTPHDRGRGFESHSDPSWRCNTAGFTIKKYT